MGDKLKSAWEIALEKLESRDDMAVASLDERQKEEIAQIRKTYQARIAEQEIESQSRMRKAVSEGAYEKLDSIREDLARNRGRLEAEMEKKVEAVRGRLESSGSPS